MKLLVALALVGLVAGSPVEFVSPMDYDYHIEVGMPLAERIRAAEEAKDFDGSRIVGGSPASLGQHPHVAGLVIGMAGGGTSVCTSSLLSNIRALTAAHCWRHTWSQANSFTVVLGSMTLFSGGTRVLTTNVEVHANYNTNTLNNDIAIIRFNAIGLNNNIQPIAIATGNNLYVGSWANAAGFGLTSDGGSIGNNQFLSWVSIQVITNAVCASTYGTQTIVGSTLCCSTAGGRGTCGGDSGGPLAIGNTLIGVTSFGHVAGCQAGHPAGFARVTSFAAWIQARM